MMGLVFQNYDDNIKKSTFVYKKSTFVHKKYICI